LFCIDFGIYFVLKVALEVTMNVFGQQRQGRSGAAPAERGQPGNKGSGAPKTAGQAKMPPGRTWLWFILILLVNFLLFRLLTPGPDAPLTIPYTLFKEQVSKGNVQAIYSRGEVVTGRFAAPITYPPKNDKRASSGSGKPETSNSRGLPRAEASRTGRNFTTTLPSFVDPGLETFLIDHGVQISAEPIEERKRQPLDDIPFRVWPGPAPHRFLFLALPPSSAAGRRHDRTHGHRSEQSAPLRPREGYQSYF
jgi:cell division protease FtsH